jgi:hypothetical protein
LRIIDVIWVSSLWVAGYCSHILYQDLHTDWRKSRQAKRQRREDDEVLRIVSGLDGNPTPEVDVASEQIKPTWRERLDDWWAGVWASTTPRTAEQLAGFVSHRYNAFTDTVSYRSITFVGTKAALARIARLRSRSETREQYVGTHRADKTLNKGSEHGLPLAQEEVSRRDSGQDRSGEGSSDERIIHEG